MQIWTVQTAARSSNGSVDQVLILRYNLHNFVNYVITCERAVPFVPFVMAARRFFLRFSLAAVSGSSSSPVRSTTDSGGGTFTMWSVKHVHKKTSITTHRTKRPYGSSKDVYIIRERVECHRWCLHLLRRHYIAHVWRAQCYQVCQRSYTTALNQKNSLLITMMAGTHAYNLRKAISAYSVWKALSGTCSIAQIRIRAILLFCSDFFVVRAGRIGGTIVHYEQAWVL